MNGDEQALFLMDTNIAIYFLGGRLANPLPKGSYYISIITEIELLSYSSLSSDKEIRIREFLSQVSVIGIESNIKEMTIELRKKHKLRLQAKMREYLENGVRLGWLTNPRDRQVEIYRTDQDLEVLSFPAELSGEQVLPGFILHLPW